MRVQPVIQTLLGLFPLCLILYQDRTVEVAQAAVEFQAGGTLRQVPGIGVAQPVAGLSLDDSKDGRRVRTGASAAAKFSSQLRHQSLQKVVF
ncbi:MAG: hypothetical protein WCC59_14685 [Terriglobales bacterium]